MTSLVPRNAGAIRRASETAADWVPHIDLDTARRLIQAASDSATYPRCQERDGLLLAVMYDGCLRISEALSLTPGCLRQTPDGWSARVLGKGRKWRETALSVSLVARLHAYAYTRSIRRDDQFFRFTRIRAWQIVQRAFQFAGVQKPEGTGYNHVFRHSGAIERLRQTGNPKALQDHLGHSQAHMTLRYLKTLSAQESLKIQQGVDLRW